MKYHCWFHFEGENKGDKVTAESSEKAAILYYAKWQDDVNVGEKIYVRADNRSVTEWSVFPEVAFTARELNTKETE